MKLEISQPIIEAARKEGVRIPSRLDYDPREALLDLKQELRTSFACECEGSRFNGTEGVIPSAIAFVVPPGVTTTAALAGADQLLGSTIVKNAAQLVSHTRALAALGDKNAKRGLQAIVTVQQIRRKKKTPMGQRSVATAKIDAKQLTQDYSKARVYQLAQITAATMHKPTIWQRIKRFIGF